MRTLSVPPPGLQRGLYRWLLLLVVASWAVAALASDPPPNSYRVVQLSTDQYARAAINASGQVAITEDPYGTPRVKFYDGTHIHDFGTFGGTSASVAGFNDLGQIAFNVVRNGVTRAGFYDGSRLHDLGTLGGPGATAAGMNRLGQVAGISSLAADPGVTRVFRWSLASGMADLGVPGAGNAVVQGINGRGDIFGRATFLGMESIERHAFFWSARTGILDVGKIGEYSYPTAMNDEGTIVGFTGTGPFGTVAFHWTRQEGIGDMGTLPNEFTWATNLNRRGQVVGATPFTTTSWPHPFLWTRGQGLLDLGVGTAERGAGTKVTDHGVVIGYLFRDFILSHGFIWTRETGLIEPGAGSDTVGSSANDVNEAGQVVGSLDGRAYTWTRDRGIVDLSSMISAGPGRLVFRSANAIARDGAIVATASSGLYLLVPSDGLHRQ